MFVKARHMENRDYLSCDNFGLKISLEKEIMLSQRKQKFTSYHCPSEGTNFITTQIQWTLESRTQTVPRGGSTFSLFDFRVKCHEPRDAMQCRAHGSTFEFLFEFQTEFFSNFLFKFQVVRESNRSTFEGPLY
jgi:hypothetical protein